MDDALGVVAGLVLGYLVGTFPTADLVTRLATRGSIDIRAVGSGNPGGFNTMQSVGAKWGVLVIVVDIVKGAAAGLLGWLVGGTEGAYAGATAGIAGHIFPVWSRFRGGKGVATSAGAVLAVFPIYFPIDAAVAATAALSSRNSARVVWVSGPIWVAAALTWWLADLPNVWGPEPTVALPIFSAASTALILGKFAASRPRAGTGTVAEPA